MSTLKYKIAKLISSANHPASEPSYESLLECIYDNAYRTVHKVPADTFFLGIVGAFKDTDTNIELANRILAAVKEVVQEALETSGIELNYTDADWDTLNIRANTGWGAKLYLFAGEDRLKTKKSFMSEFFEL